MGRPRVDEPVRPVSFSLRASDVEVLRRKAAVAGMSMSGLVAAWAREMAVVAPPPVAERPVLPLRRRPDGTPQEVVDPAVCAHPADRHLVLEWGTVCKECGTRLV